MGKLEFGSTAWITAVGVFLQDHLGSADLADVTYRFCEVFTDPPKHLVGDDGELAWHYLVDGGRVRFGLGRVPSDVTVTCDYGVAKKLAVLPLDQAQALAAAAAADGRLTRVGPPTPAVLDLSALHDHINASTA